MFIDLFSGCGGLSLGAYLAGLKNSVEIDCDKDLTSSFSKNFPAEDLLVDYLAELEPKDLRKKTVKIDRMPSSEVRHAKDLVSWDGVTRPTKGIICFSVTSNT